MARKVALYAGVAGTARKARLPEILRKAKYFPVQIDHGFWMLAIKFAQE
jgi:hypothetical protein